jgi:hypothetical protein
MLHLVALLVALLWGGGASHVTTAVPHHPPVMHPMDTEGEMPGV